MNKEMSKVELFEVIRKQHRDEGVGIRELARRHGVHRRMVRQALASAVPPDRKTPERESPALGPHKATIRAWWEADQQAPPKQRHTARRVWQRLVAEHGAQVAESTVREYVAEVRRELGDAAGAVTIVQEHGPGEEAEVDFAEFRAWVAGCLLRLWMFALRLSHSGRGFHVVFANQAQEAFFQGFVEGFAALGGVPAVVRLDNLKPAVTRVLIGRDRIENERFIALRSHYGFDSWFCTPGAEGAHEKGGVEGEVGRFRRRHLVPIPEVGSLDELNERCRAADAADDARRIGRRADTVGEAFAVEASWLRPLPAEPFDAATELSAKVDAKARICVLQSWYSVPARLARRRVTVRLGARHLEVLDPGSGAVCAAHQRSLHKGAQVLELDHYLEILTRKPGALGGSVALRQARQSGAFTDAHQRFWDAARDRYGDRKGTIALIEVLQAHRRLPADAVVAGINAVLAAGSVDPTLVPIEARAWQDGSPVETVPVNPGLARYDRALPDLGGYDQLLAAPTATVGSDAVGARP